VRELAAAAGFKEQAFWGNAFVYMVQFIKPA
jgi:hypothetical protein